MQEKDIYYEEEIDLFELIMLLWKKKTLIILTTLIFALVAGGFTKLFVSPVYETRMQMQVTNAGAVSTKYGTYNTIIKSSNELVDLMKTDDVLLSTIKDLNPEKEITVLQMRDRIKTEVSPETPNTFVVKVAGKSPEDSFKLANILYDNFTTYINTKLNEESLRYFQDSYRKSLESMELELSLNRELLRKDELLAAEIPVSYINKELLGSVITNNNLMLQNIINPNKIAVDGRIVEYKNIINSIETRMAHYSTLLTMMDEDLAQLNTGNPLNLTFAQDNILLASDLILPTKKTSPSTLMNTVIGGVLGGMLSVFYVFAYEWYMSRKKEELGKNLLQG